MFKNAILTGFCSGDVAFCVAMLEMAFSLECFRTYVVDYESAVVGGPLLGHEVDVERRDFAAVAMRHAFGHPVISGVHGTVETVVEVDPDVHLARLAGGGHLRRELRFD